MTWDVFYSDGEEETNLCLECVREFVPYAKGHKVEFRGDDYEFYAGKIVAVHDDETYDIKGTDGTIFRSRALPDIRRMTEGKKLTVGSRVFAYYPDTDEWYPGHLSGINNDHSYAVSFDDGDFLQQVPPRHVRALRR